MSKNILNKKFIMTEATLNLIFQAHLNDSTALKNHLTSEELLNEDNADLVSKAVGTGDSNNAQEKIIKAIIALMVLAGKVTKDK